MRRSELERILSGAVSDIKSAVGTDPFKSFGIGILVGAGAVLFFRFVLILALVCLAIIVLAWLFADGDIIDGGTHGS